jgi:hypothetical protein
MSKGGYGKHPMKGKYFEIDCSFVSYDGTWLPETVRELLSLSVESIIIISLGNYSNGE